VTFGWRRFRPRSEYRWDQVTGRLSQLLQI